MSDASNLAGIMEWGVAARPLASESVSGDLHLVLPVDRGALLAVIDGLGHGPEAAFAAEATAAALAEGLHLPLIELVRHCHERLRKTRGVVMSLAAVEPERGRLSWIGVGNIETVLFRADPATRPGRESLLCRSGVVGYQLPPLRLYEMPIFAGDVLMLATDGLHNSFSERSPIGEPPQTVATDCLDRYGKTTDDGLILVARYLGAS